MWRQSAIDRAQITCSTRCQRGCEHLTRDPSGGAHATEVQRIQRPLWTCGRPEPSARAGGSGRTFRTTRASLIGRTAPPLRGVVAVGAETAAALQVRGTSSARSGRRSARFAPLRPPPNRRSGGRGRVTLHLPETPAADGCSSLALLVRAASVRARWPEMWPQS